jgi:hypothetical protein
MNLTASTTNVTITCGQCGTVVPVSASVYVDGGGQMCVTCFPEPPGMEDIEPPF